MTNLGIYLDLNSAHIITADEHDKQIQITVHSGVEPKTRADMDDEHLTIVSQQKKGNRREGEIHHYFEDLIKHLPHGLESFVVFGPGEAKKHFKNYLEAKHAPIFSHLKTIETTDILTENQMKAFVREFYLID